MKMENLNSGVKITESDELFLGGRAAELTPLLFRVPVYWVSPDLMDRIYPPERRRFLHPECLREMLESLENAEEINWEALLERIERCRDWSGGFAAVGLYLSRIGERTREIVREETGREIPDGPSIFIAPERVEEWAREASAEIPFFEPDWGFRFFLAKVLVHELAHAYMDGGRNGRTFWERVIEESLANAFAYRSVAALASDAERMAFEKITSQQPLEYHGWRLFIENGPFSCEPWIFALSFWGKAWRRRSTFWLWEYGPLRRLLGDRYRYYRALRWDPWDLLTLLRKYQRMKREILEIHRRKIIESREREYREKLEIIGKFFWPHLALNILRALA